MPYQVDNEKCIGCSACVAVCPNGMKMNAEGKAEIISQSELEKCKGESICPVEAIEKKP